MINVDNKLFCRIDGLSVAVREQQRLLAMTAIGLLEPESIPVFEEATQTAAHTLDAPICILGLMEQHYQRFKSAIGLSRLGLMNDLATSRQVRREESFCTHVVDSQQILVINDTLTHPAFSNSLLTHQYGIRAYLGVPLMTSSGCCIGTLAVMDLQPREFTTRDIEFLELTARWGMSEFERQQSSKFSAPTMVARPSVAPPSIANQLKVELLSQFTQELRTPLTSVMGMASVLNREIYGPLTSKQREYIDIIHRSGQYLLSLVNEILELSALKDSTQELNLASVDIEMLCQQAINTLEQAAHRREQQIRLSVEPGRRVWLLDKDKLRQMLYHLVFSVIQSSNAGSIVRLHVSRRGNNLNIAVWVSHPWLGEGLAYNDLYHQPLLISAGTSSVNSDPYDNRHLSEFEGNTLLESASKLGFAAREETGEGSPSDKGKLSALTSEVTNHLGIMLCRQLAEMHGGQLTVQSVSEAGYRYVISLPQIAGAEDHF